MAEEKMAAFSFRPLARLASALARVLNHPFITGKIMKLLHNTAAALCCSLILAAMPALAIEYALPAANSRLVGRTWTTWCPRKRANPGSGSGQIPARLDQHAGSQPKADPLLLQAGREAGRPHQLITAGYPP